MLWSGADIVKFPAVNDLEEEFAANASGSADDNGGDELDFDVAYECSVNGVGQGYADVPGYLHEHERFVGARQAWFVLPEPEEEKQQQVSAAAFANAVVVLNER
ncbi:unnamed protein product [Protopolystoma xenopodis]|uniref:Uncharacterized protein n=1 Tax=Protopolystoma xenopodis TaxID=117903 RepID=A0A3S5B9H1_9PLAT|nr:unnamed protein product [Protopolystoma xenopodis]